MTIKHSDKIIQFEIVGYEFPDIDICDVKGSEYDANWLIVKALYSEKGKEQQIKDACILTFELEGLVQGFRNVILGIESHYKSDFMEPYLCFNISGSGDLIEISIKMYCYDCSKNDYNSYMVTELIALEKAKSILSQLELFAQRFPVKNR